MRRKVGDGHDAKLVRIFHPPDARRNGRGRKAKMVGNLLVGCPPVDAQLVNNTAVNIVDDEF
jgi:hypothetical protein